ncbi:protein-L-isoaspartate O-methyltransferase family protein [Chitinilyticum litopenaei]|uniref:protein-L-isoaspartate O-methyltransferase family protein n=1 Tax=Chitinilyticum litopenaei TaxID=1121276 RepID=UPI0003F99813|nr:protein-L-isoaspartate O-methyltransferase [Chitinilyticum litopenaei]
MDWDHARYLMVEQQIRTWNVTDMQVLQRFLDVKREDFVPADKKELALADIELPLGDGVFMLAPKIEAKFLQESAIKPTDRVLVIGATTGYLVALAAGLASQVYGVEARGELVEFANAALKNAGIKNAQVVQGDAGAALAGQAPFDLILVCASAPALPQAYIDQLAEQGRLIMVVGEQPVMTARLVTRSAGGAVQERGLFEYNLPAFAAQRAIFAF